MRYKYAVDYVKDNDTVLDIACGVGYGSSLLANESGAQQIWGVDLSAEAVDFAERIFNACR